MEHRLLPQGGDGRPSGPLAKPALSGDVIRYDRIEVPEGDHTWNALDYWRLVRRHAFAIAALVLLGGAIGVALDLAHVPTFQVRTTLEIQPMGQNVGGQGAEDFRQGGDFETQLAIMRSRSVIDGARKALTGKERPVTYQPSRLSALAKRYGIDVPYVTSAPGYDSLLQQVAGSVKFKPITGTRIVEISCESPDANLASEFANTVAEVYIEQSLQARWEAAEKSSKWLAMQVNQLKSKLQKSEGALQSYASNAGLAFTQNKDTVAEADLQVLRQELSKAQTELAAKRSRAQRASAAGEEHARDLNDQAIQAYETQLAALRKQLAELTASFTPEHYRVRMVQAQLTEVQNSLKTAQDQAVRRVQGDFEESERYVRMLESAYNKQAALASQLAQKEINYNILKREVDADQLVYQGMLQKVKEMTIDSAAHSNLVRLIDPAAATRSPNTGHPFQNSMMGLVSGLFLAGLFVAIRERLGRSFHQPGEGSLMLGVPELGAIPAAAADLSLPARDRGSFTGLLSSIRNSADREEVGLVSWREKPSLIAESFRTMLASILFSGANGDHPQTIAFTSPQAREGKSTIVSNTGIVMAEIGRRVLLIDGDLRNPRLHKIFDLPNTWGLCDLLQESQSLDSSPLESLARPTTIPNLYVLPSGPGTASISHLVFSPRVGDLLRRLRRDFDMILIDTPPVLPFFEARLFGRLSDAVVLVVRSGHSKCVDARIAASRLSQDHARLLGVVLNEWNPKATGHAYDSYYRYQSM